MEAKHTATPWEAKRVEQAGNGEWLWCVYDEAGMVVAKRLSQAKAERIVRAVNAHDDLVKALTASLQFVLDRADKDELPEEWSITKTIRAALSRIGAA